MILESRGGRGIRSHWKRAPRYPFVATVKATDLHSGMRIQGLTTNLSDGGCCVATRKGPFSAGTQILLEITKNGVSLLTKATVVYNLKDQFMGIRFEEMPPDQAAILCRLDKSCNRSGQPWPDGSLTTSRGFLSSTERHEFERRSRSALGIVTCPPDSKQPRRDDEFAAVRAMTEPVTQARLVPA